MIYDGDRYIGCWMRIVRRNKSAIAETLAPILRRDARFVFLGQPGDGKQVLARFGNVLLKGKKNKLPSCEKFKTLNLRE